MSDSTPPSGPNAVPPEQGRRAVAAVRITIGLLVGAYYLQVLVAMVRGLRESRDVHMTADYVAPGLPALLHWFSLPGGAGLVTALTWVVTVALVVGGVAIVANQRRGMQLGLIALAVSLVEDLLFGLPTSLAIAMGWIRVSFTSPPRLAETSARLQELPPEAMRIGGAMALAVGLLGVAVRAGVLLWLRRHLVRTRPLSRG